jgi:RNA polymerase sigma factor (sigma-70 family)
MGLALQSLGQKQSATEQQLVAAVRQGDDRAFEELFARYRSRIAAYVLGMVRDHARAEDVTQEVFLSALRRLRDTERPIAFKPWIYEIARNACIDEFRRTRRTSEVSLNADDDSASGDGNLVSKQPTPDAAMENKQRLEALRDAFRGLSENHHRILVMRELEGLSYGEIAHRMGMSRPMVESTLFRARRRLGEEYQELSSGRRCRQVCEVVDRADATTVRVLGIRARRQVALHLSHCDDCRRYARLAGADEVLFRAPTFVDKVAALLPFGWLGRRLAGQGKSAHAFIARHASSASQYVDAVGSTGILGRMAAAVLVIAAAGGGYAGVSLTTGSTPAHKAVAIHPLASRSTSTARQARRAEQGQRSSVATAAALRHGSQAGGKTGKVVAGASGGGGGPTAAIRPTGAGPSTGGGASSPAGTIRASGTSPGSHTGAVEQAPTGRDLGPVLSPIAPHLPSPGTKPGPPPSLHLPSTPSVPSAPNPPSLPGVPNPTPQLPVPNPKTVVGQAGQTAGTVTNSAGQALNTITTPRP